MQSSVASRAGARRQIQEAGVQIVDGQTTIRAVFSTKAYCGIIKHLADRSSSHTFRGFPVRLHVDLSFRIEPPSIYTRSLLTDSFPIIEVEFAMFYTEGSVRQLVLFLLN